MLLDIVFLLVLVATAGAAGAGIRIGRRFAPLFGAGLRVILISIAYTNHVFNKSLLKQPFSSVAGDVKHLIHIVLLA